MSEQVMSLNLDVVVTAINSISVMTADIQTRNKKFMELLRSKNEATQGKFQLLATLEEKIKVEAQNFDKMLEAQDEIIQSVNRYAEMAEAAQDDSCFNRD